MPQPSTASETIPSGFNPRSGDLKALSKYVKIHFRFAPLPSGDKTRLNGENERIGNVKQKKELLIERPIFSQMWIFIVITIMCSADNTHLLRKRKYHCTADLQFDWSGFDQARESLDNINIGT